MMIKDWSIDEIKEEINKIVRAESDPRMDGFVTWGCKKDLYELMFYIQQKLDNCSTYWGEEEFLKERNG